VRISYDPEIDAAYIHFTDQPLEPGRHSIPCGAPPGVQAMVVMDWVTAQDSGCGSWDSISAGLAAERPETR
jgi:hypothetical protein